MNGFFDKNYIGKLFDIQFPTSIIDSEKEIMLTCGYLSEFISPIAIISSDRSLTFCIRDGDQCINATFLFAVDAGHYIMTTLEEIN